jgi:hypothetical protein
MEDNMRLFFNEKKFYRIIVASILLSGLLLSCSQQKKPVSENFAYALKHKSDLQLGIYITAHSVRDHLSSPEGRSETLDIFHKNNATLAFVEVYRGGLVVDEKLLKETRDFFRENNIDVIGGIATVPGKDFGVHQEGPLGWFNWQNPKTQNDLEKVVKMAAGIFDVFIIDDFLCTGDTSLESKEAKGDRSWSQYRRDLLSGLSETLFINPAKKINPNITMIIKYPQWYDRFHLFGYDVEREPKLFDKVWVGTETRGQYTQRYGFVQPYEGFINYRWLADISGDKIEGAWFDHGDCDADDFIEQAYQTVLAGAKRINLFHFGDFLKGGHPGQKLLAQQFKQLVTLAEAVAKNPVNGPVGYKPPSSDAGGDLYLMDFIGMFGTSFVPSPVYPQNSKVVFLPTQAAADADILQKIEKSIKNNATLILTSGFIAKAKEGKKIAKLAGIKWPLKTAPLNAAEIIVDGKAQKVEHGLDLEAKIRPAKAKTLLTAKAGKKKIPFFLFNRVNGSKIFTLNSHTFSQQDFDRVGEVLLCPKQLGLLELPQTWAETIRRAFNEPYGVEFNAPLRVSFQILTPSSVVVQNYNKSAVKVSYNTEKIKVKMFKDAFSGKTFTSQNGNAVIELGPRSHVWLKTAE